MEPMPTPNRPRTPRDQREVAAAGMAAAVVFFLAWWVFGDGLPSLSSFAGWGPLIIAALVACVTFIIGLALTDKDEVRPGDPDRGTV